MPEIVLVTPLLSVAEMVGHPIDDNGDYISMDALCCSLSQYLDYHDGDVYLAGVDCLADVEFLVRGGLCSQRADNVRWAISAFLKHLTTTLSLSGAATDGVTEHRYVGVQPDDTLVWTTPAVTHLIPRLMPNLM